MKDPILPAPTILPPHPSSVPPAPHAASHEDGGSDEISVAGLSGLLADDQNPTAHASDHEDGGSDEISVAGLSGALADPQTPSTHASSHEDGGADEISVAGLSGELADPQTPKTHSASHEDGGADEISVAGLSGALADPQTPSSHAASHQHGGSDEIATATPAPDAIPKADGSGELDAWISGSQLWRDQVDAFFFVGTRTIGQIDALAPIAAECVVAGSAGTPALAGSDTLAIGDLAEYDRADDAWKKIVSHAGGFPPAGTRAAVASIVFGVSLYSPLVAGDTGKIVQWDGTSLTPASLVSEPDGAAVSVRSGVGNQWILTYRAGFTAWLPGVGAGMLGDGLQVSVGPYFVDLKLDGTTLEKDGFGLRANVGTAAGTVAAGSHAAQHQDSGADEIATATPAPDAIPKADGSALLDAWISLASTTLAGRARKATLAEVNAGTATVPFVSPYDLAARVKVISDDAVITPAALTGTTHDYDPTDFGDAALVRLSSTTTVDLTGMNAPSAFTVKYLVNSGSSIIKLKDEDTGSLAANRFAINADISIQANEGVILIYDTISARWRAMGKHI